MGKQLIVSISREFGSGGRAIAEQISKDLNLPLLDRNILEEIAKEKQVGTENFKGADEKPKKPFLSKTVRGYSSSMEDAFAEMQFEYLRKKADAGESFVALGRCSDTVLKGVDGLIAVFVLGDREAKVARIMERYHLNEADALSKINRHDKKRKTYHNTYSKSKWGDSRGYDLCINSSRLGVEGTAKLIEQYIADREEKR